MLSRLLLLVVIVGSLLSILGAVNGLSSSDSPSPITTVAVQMGDDNADGVIDEDESGWNCATMGNGLCGTVTQTFEDGSSQVLCEGDLILYSTDGTDSIESLVCIADPALSL